MPILSLITVLIPLITSLIQLLMHNKPAGLSPAQQTKAGLLAGHVLNLQKALEQCGVSPQSVPFPSTEGDAQ